MRRFVTLLAATVLAVAAHGQTTINGGRRIQGVWDASGASASKPAPTGAGLPGSCEVGEQYFRTDAPAGQNLYLCTAPDTWTAISGGGGTAGGTLTVNAAEAAGTNLSDTTPAAPSMGAITNRGINVKWQKDASAPDNVSAYIPYGGLLLPTMNVRRWGMLAAPGAGSNPTVFGDYVGGNQGAISSLEPDANDGTLTKYRSDATVGSRAGTSGASNWRTGRNIHGMWEGKIGQTSGVRAWVTWSSYTPNGDAFTQGHGAGFRYSSCAEGCANDTNWQCVAYNGTTSIADSGVPPSTTRTQLLEVIYSDDSSPRTLTYRIDGVPVCEFKSDEHHIPNVGQNTKLIFYVWSQDGTAKDIYLAWALTSTDR